MSDENQQIQVIDVKAVKHLPMGATEFEAWAKDIISLSRVPDNDSARYALATMILSLPQDKDEASLETFVKMLNKSASNQVASFIMYELKEKQKQAQQKEAEVTAANQVASDGPSQ